MSDNRKCRFHQYRKATDEILVEGVGIVDVCLPCEDRILNKGFVCKYCHVEIISRTDTRAILGREHKKSCIRRNK